MPDQVMAGEKIKANKENQKTRHAIAGHPHAPRLDP
jgi:hypothetical protein